MWLAKSGKFLFILYQSHMILWSRKKNKNSTESNQRGWKKPKSKDRKRMFKRTSQRRHSYTIVFFLEEKVKYPISYSRNKLSMLLKGPWGQHGTFTNRNGVSIGNKIKLNVNKKQIGPLIHGEKYFWVWFWK